jgi:endonuclease/exonuclease/phosphatase family metal-dependent hydrolase
MDRRLIALLVVAVAIPAQAAEVRIATWNVREGFTAEAIRERASDLRKFGEAVKPDVLLVQEIVSLDVLKAVRDAIGLKGYHVACSDFSPSDEPDFFAFEVGIISRYPLSQVIEYDPSLDYVPGKDAPPELLLEPQLKLGIRQLQDDARGFLWARIDALEMTFVVLHLKSARGAAGPEDYENAKKREFVAAAVAVGVLDDRQFWPTYTCVVGGDFNVGHSDKAKNGSDLFHDSLDAGKGDGYDDTHAIFSQGIVGGLRMKNLTLGTMTPSYPGFPGTPIDNLYIVGARAAYFSPAKIEEDTFSSDHRPVWTTAELSVDPKAKAPTLASGFSDQPLPPKVASAPVPKPTGPAKEIPVDEAKNHVNEFCTVEFEVQGGRLLDGGTLCFLNSMEDFRDKNSFTVVLRTKAIKGFAAKGITDPSQELRGKKVRVTGMIAQRNGQFQTEVDDASEIIVK